MGQVCLNELASMWPKLGVKSSQGHSEGPYEPLCKRVLEDGLEKEVVWVSMVYQGTITS